MRNKWGVVWSFKTEKLEVILKLDRDHGYKYDGDDEDGQTQRDLDSGKLVAFNSHVIVLLDGEEIGSDSLYGSVYENGNASKFWTAHRDPDHMNRNCSLLRAERGNVIICHYFPDMVRTATQMARDYLRKMPRVRAA
jgi:hypothetical protein